MYTGERKIHRRLYRALAYSFQCSCLGCDGLKTIVAAMSASLERYAPYH
jgi:hypothetical protein